MDKPNTNSHLDALNAALRRALDGDLSCRIGVPDSRHQAAITIDLFNDLISKLSTSVDEVGAQQRKFKDLHIRLQNSEIRYRALVEASTDAILISDHDTGAFLDANRTACQLFGYRPSDLRRMSFDDLFTDPASPEIQNLKGELKRDGLGVGQVSLNRQGGQPFLGEIRVMIYGPPGRELRAATVRDLTERVEREQEIQNSYDAVQETQTELERSEEKYRTLVEAAGDAIVILDKSTARIAEANGAACQLLGHNVQELRKLTIEDFYLEPDLGEPDEFLTEAVGAGRAWKPNVQMRRANGSSFWAEVRTGDFITNEGTRSIGVIRDVTWRIEREQEVADSYRQLEETQAKLVQASKLSAMGELGAGIAHELNQPITIIQGFAQRVRRDESGRVEEHIEELDIIVDETVRMARIVDNISTFARQSDYRPEPTNPITPVENALLLLHAQLRVRGIQIIRDVSENLPQINADTARMQQVFLNLIVNARDALSELPAGTARQIRVAIRAEDDHVLYEIEDNGPGISPALEQRIFEPFFTSKPPGEGTGLGLSIAYGIIQDHGGDIRLERPQTTGARFVVSLPVLQGNPEPLFEGTPL